MPETRFRKLLFLLTCVFCFSLAAFASDSFVPSLPAITQALHTHASLTKLTVSLYFLSLGISTLIYGPLIGQIGSRKTLFTGLSLLGLGSIVCLFSQHISLLIAGRILQGFGAGACMTVPRSVVPTFFQGKALTKVASTLALIAAFVPAAAPVAGSYVQHAFGWHANFSMILIISVIAVTLAYFNMAEITKKKATFSLTKLVTDYSKELQNKRFLLCPIIGGLSYLAVITYITLTPFLFQNELGYTAIQYSHIALVISLALIIGAIISRQLANHLSNIQALTLAGSVMAIGSVSLIGVHLLIPMSTLSIAIPCFIILMGVQMITSNTFSLSMQLTTNIGIASALIGFLQLAGSGGLANLLSLLHSHSGIPLGLVLSTITLTNLVCIRFLATKLKPA